MNACKFLKRTLIVLMLACSTSVGTAWGQNDQKELKKEPAILTAEPLADKPGDGEILKLKRALYNERMAIMRGYYVCFRSGRDNQCRVVLNSARRVYSAGMEVFVTPEQKTRLLGELLELASDLGSLVAEREEQFRGNGFRETYLLQLQHLREFRLEIQIELAKLKKAQKPAAPK
jgi:hypothetical protein